jgi:hypothetical protein
MLLINSDDAVRADLLAGFGEEELSHPRGTTA